jgi:hypothetical protein
MAASDAADFEREFGGGGKCIATRMHRGGGRVGLLPVERDGVAFDARFGEPIEIEVAAANGVFERDAVFASAAAIGIEGRRAGKGG